MKGQYFSFDAIVAAVIFVLALVALLSYWHSVRSFLEYQNDPLSKETIRVSNLLFMPPSSSSCGSMDSFGLVMAWNDRRVDAAVLDCARLQSQEWLKAGLGTPYGVVINVTDISGPSTITIGGGVPASATNVVKIRRLATVADGADTYLALVDLTMYR